MAASRHLILFEVRLWRRTRLVLAIIAATLLALSALLHSWLPNDPNTPNAVGLLGVVALGSVIAIWARMRLSYVAVGSRRVVIRRGWRRAALDPVTVRQARVASLKNLYSGAARPAMPQPAAAWNQVPALALRLDAAAVDRSLIRTVGTSAMIGNEVVLPVADAAGLLIAIQARLAAHGVASGAPPATNFKAAPKANRAKRTGSKPR